MHASSWVQHSPVGGPLPGHLLLRRLLRLKVALADQRCRQVGDWARGAVSPDLASRSVPPASGTSKLQRRMAGIAARVGCPQQRCQRHSPSSSPMVAPPSRCGWRSFSRSSCSSRAAAGARPGATSCCRHRQACCCELCQLHAINQTAHRCELGLGPAADDGHYLIVAVAAHTQVARHPADTGGGSVSTSGGRRGGSARAAAPWSPTPFFHASFPS